MCLHLINTIGIDFDDVNEALLESTRGVAQATEGLIQAAAAAQAERSETLSPQERYNDDIAWANGLISAAQQIAATIKMLV